MLVHVCKYFTNVFFVDSGPLNVLVVGTVFYLSEVFDSFRMCKQINFDYFNICEIIIGTDFTSSVRTDQHKDSVEQK